MNSSQAPAPHGAMVLLQAPTQQLPVPSAPQISETQSKLSPHGPALVRAKQTPFLQVNAGAQSKGEAQVELQLPASSQPKSSGHGLPPSRVWQTPAPSQLLGLRVASAQAVPQRVPSGG